MGSEEHHCPECGQPVETVVRRHKTLGAWVPTWVAGPCRNPECDAYAGGDAEHHEHHEHRKHHEHHEPPEAPTAKNS